MSEWKNVTDTFSEEERHYNGKYLEIDEVYDDVVEVSVFSALDEPYEIYFTYDIFSLILIFQHFFSGICTESESWSRGASNEILEKF